MILGHHAYCAKVHVTPLDAAGYFLDFTVACNCGIEAPTVEETAQDALGTNLPDQRGATPREAANRIPSEVLQRIACAEFAHGFTPTERNMAVELLWLRARCEAAMALANVTVGLHACEPRGPYRVAQEIVDRFCAAMAEGTYIAPRTGP